MGLGLGLVLSRVLERKVPTNILNVYIINSSV